MSRFDHNAVLRNVRHHGIAVLIASATLAPAARAQQPFHVLQPLSARPVQLYDSLAKRRVWYVPNELDYVRWGRLPDRAAKPIITVPSGSDVTFDVISHEGVLEDQGRDPVRFFARYGVPRSQVLNDAIAVAASSIPHDFVRDGPHVISPPVAIAGAEPGDILRVDVVALTPRVPYGMTSIRHGKGALPQEFPQTPPPAPGASAQHPELYHSVFVFVPITETANGWMGTEHTRAGDVHIPLHPFLGTMGVAVDTTAPPNSVPPGTYGGNLDIKDLTVGSTLYLPVQVPGALFYVSDSHFNEGNGEVDLTAIEGSLRATVRLTLIKKGSANAPMHGALTWPVAETPRYWIPIGLDPDLNIAMRNATTEGIRLLVDRYGMTPTDAYAYLSIGADFDVSEVVDITKGVHGLIDKHELPTRR